MARIKFSPIISDVKGKIGNIVFQGGKSGTIIRERVLPRNPKTQLQSIKRGLLNEVKSEWQNLTTDQRNSWLSLSSFMKQKQKNDQTKQLTGYELFVQSNFIRNQASITSVFETSLRTSTVSGYSNEVDVLNPSSFIMSVEAFTSDADMYVSLYMSRPFRQSASIAQSEVRYLGTVFSSFGNIDLTQAYQEMFGVLPVSGQKALIKNIAFLPSDGWIAKQAYQDLIFE